MSGGWRVVATGVPSGAGRRGHVVARVCTVAAAWVALVVPQLTACAPQRIVLAPPGPQPADTSASAPADPSTTSRPSGVAASAGGRPAAQPKGKGAAGASTGGQSVNPSPGASTGSPTAPAATTTAPADTSARRPRVDPARAQRFEIVAVGDSTFSFLALRAPWVAAGKRGIAVDPRRRDALVARFEVLARRADTTMALVTGQTQRVTTDLVALLERPPVDTVVRADTVRVVRRTSFWTGAAAGVVLGVLGGLLIPR